MNFVSLLLGFGVSATPVQDLEPAYRILTTLGFMADRRPVLRRYDEDSEPYVQKNFHFGSTTVSLRSDNSLFTFWWHPTKEQTAARAEHPQAISDGELSASAKAYVSKLWPATKFKFYEAVNGADSMRPSRIFPITAILNGHPTDHYGHVEMDSIGGELLVLRSADTPLPPSKLEAKLSEADAQAILLTHIVAKYDARALWISKPVAVRAFSPERDAYKKPSRLVYSVEAFSYIPEQMDGSARYGSWHGCAIDPVSGEILVDRRGGLGGSAPFDKPLPRMKEMKFRSVILAKDSTKPVRNGGFASIREQPEKAMIVDGRQVILVGAKALLRATWEKAKNRLIFETGKTWVVATPDKVLRAAL